jgi:hypothetical protein
LIGDVAVENFDRKSVSRHFEKNFRRKGAVKNNPNRFPAGYVIELDEDEKNKLVENFHQFNRLKQFVGAGHARDQAVRGHGPLLQKCTFDLKPELHI